MLSIEPAYGVEEGCSSADLLYFLEEDEVVPFDFSVFLFLQQVLLLLVETHPRVVVMLAEESLLQKHPLLLPRIAHLPGTRLKPFVCGCAPP